MTDNTPEIVPETVAPDVVDTPVDEVAPEDDNTDPALTKARKEAAGYRQRLRAAETTSTVLRDQLITLHLGDDVTPAALTAAGIDLADLVTENGVTKESVQAAADEARKILGIRPNRFQGTADQGAGRRQVAPTAQPTWGNLLTQPTA